MLNTYVNHIFTTTKINANGIAIWLESKKKGEENPLNRDKIYFHCPSAEIWFLKMFWDYLRNPISNSSFHRQKWCSSTTEQCSHWDKNLNLEFEEIFVVWIGLTWGRGVKGGKCPSNVSLPKNILCYWVEEGEMRNKYIFTRFIVIVKRQRKTKNLRWNESFRNV